MKTPIWGEKQPCREYGHTGMHGIGKRQEIKVWVMKSASEISQVCITALP